ncbi:MAG TPA: DUF1326 domain-containing protein [Armatimonadaceae bacterium]|nr:DUF1326 domain-containing protein [Armatimonadaceae bacterium]
MTKTISLLGALGAALTVAPAAFAAGVTGDYVEARSASVYAGPCHYNGELTTAGREAVLGMRVREGEYAGADLSGLAVAAAVSGSDNLADAKALRRSVVYVPETATQAQRSALVALIKAKAGATLGDVVAVKAVPLSLTVDAKAATLTGGEALSLSLLRYPCQHCVMPSQVWYSPFVKTSDALVAQSLKSGFSEKALGVTWRQEPSDNGFVGAFSL